jgi:hypothetical protein
MAKYKSITQKAIDHFNNLKVPNIIIDPETGCHNWKGSCSPKGYAQLVLYVRNTKIGHNSYRSINELYRVNRIAYAIAHPSENIDHRVIRHTCDNPKCCNPDHLLSGTQSENILDKIKRGRQASGSNIASSKLTEDKVKELRKDRVAGMTYKKLAIKYGVTYNAVYSVINGLTWKHLR